MIQFPAMLGKIWKVYPKISDDLITQLLTNRGIKSVKQEEEFFNPKLENYTKDIEIAGIKKAKGRILEAVKSGELIVVYGDYDVDGICGAAVLYHGLTSIGAKVLPYIPHREKEGYGLSRFGIDQVIEKGAGLVISVDCGIVANEVAEYVKGKLDLIITDHHQIGEKKPDAYAIVHSIKMCGAAVAWCLVRQMLDKEQAEELLDFVGVATVCDLIPLVGVNRFFVKRGLEILNATKRVGWRALFSKSGISPGSLGVFGVGFVIGPRLNAIGRLEHAMDGLRLLCTRDLVKAQSLAELLCSANDQRKKLTLDAVDEAKIIVGKILDQKILVVHSKNWIPGVIGLVAGRICEEYGVATIAISEGEEFSKGSARSVHGLDIVETIRYCSDMLVDVGGHKGAAGFTIATKNIEEFKVRIKEAVPVDYQVEEPVLQIDAEVPVSTLSKKLARELEEFEPCGLGNPIPVLMSSGVAVREVRGVGEGKHLKVNLDGVEGIAFGMGNLLSLIKPGQLVDVAYNLEIDNFNGNEKLQLKIKDLHPV